MSFGSDLPRRLGLSGLRLGRIELYVLGHTLPAVGGALAVIVAIVMLIDFVELRARSAGASRSCCGSWR